MRKKPQDLDGAELCLVSVCDSVNSFIFMSWRTPEHFALPTKRTWSNISQLKQAPIVAYAVRVKEKNKIQLAIDWCSTVHRFAFTKILTYC